jgi:hypothetical protein
MNIQISGDSVEAVALQLLHIVAFTEGKSLFNQDGASSREWILSTYAECLKVTKGKTKPDH